MRFARCSVRCVYFIFISVHLTFWLYLPAKIYFVCANNININTNFMIMSCRVLVSWVGTGNWSTEVQLLSHASARQRGACQPIGAAKQQMRWLLNWEVYRKPLSVCFDLVFADLKCIKKYYKQSDDYMYIILSQTKLDKLVDEIVHQTLVVKIWIDKQSLMNYFVDNRSLMN